jgi:hypothetical protein
MLKFKKRVAEQRDIWFKKKFVSKSHRRYLQYYQRCSIVRPAQRCGVVFWAGYSWPIPVYRAPELEFLEVMEEETRGNIWSVHDFTQASIVIDQN